MAHYSTGAWPLFAPGLTAKEGRAELPDHAMPPVLAGTDVLEKTPGNLGQAKGILKLPIGEKSSVGSDLGTVELKLQATVEIQPWNPIFRFTYRVSHINTHPTRQ